MVASTSTPNPETRTGDEPFLVFRRTGKTIGKALGFGFGGSTLVLGLISAMSNGLRAEAIWPAFKGYGLAALPFIIFGAVLAACRRELWFVPDCDAFHMLTFRPWHLKGPRVEQAPISEYDGLCRVALTHRGEADSTAVALMTNDGQQVPIREFSSTTDAESFLEELATVTGLKRKRAAAEPAGDQKPESPDPKSPDPKSPDPKSPESV